MLLLSAVLISDCATLSGAGGCVDLWRNTAPAWEENGTYNDYAFTREAEAIIAAHPHNHPLFLYQAFQNVHGPYEVPTKYRELFPPDESCQTQDGTLHYVGLRCVSCACICLSGLQLTLTMLPTLLTLASLSLAPLPQGRTQDCCGWTELTNTHTSLSLAPLPQGRTQDCCGWTELTNSTDCKIASKEGICKCPNDELAFQPATLNCPPGG